MEKRKIRLEIEVDVVDLLAEDAGCMVAGIYLHGEPVSESSQNEDMAVQLLGFRLVNEIVEGVGIDRSRIILTTKII